MLVYSYLNKICIVPNDDLEDLKVVGNLVVATIKNIGNIPVAYLTEYVDADETCIRCLNARKNKTKDIYLDQVPFGGVFFNVL